MPYPHVSLREEGVDLSGYWDNNSNEYVPVSLREEGVDLSSLHLLNDLSHVVSLREEGVDLSNRCTRLVRRTCVSLREEGVDLSLLTVLNPVPIMSPSARREWI